MAQAIGDMARSSAKPPRPVLFLLGSADQMTQPKAAQGLIQAAQGAGRSVQVVRLPVGHHQMTEAPDETLAALRDLLRT